MDSFNQTTGFLFDSNSNSSGDSEDLGILEIYVHHARNIHNICIYDNQDVYAKFSLTYNPDQTHSTRIINGGGKNPEFNENLFIKLTQLDAVLKCEIWMLSRVRNYLEDQLLGFALVPISQILGKGKVTQDYSLSSTDLFHSPAGTVKLSLFLKNTSFPVKTPNLSASNSSISAEIVLLDPIEYSRIEFPDINVVRENQQMVSEFFDSKPCSFLHLGASPYQVDDYEMTMNTNDPDRNSNSGFLSSTTTSISDGNSNSNSSDSIEKKAARTHSSDSLNVEVNPGSVTAPDTPTSKKGGSEIRDHVSPLGNTNLEAEQSAMQQQIVDMYMRSMQQFTESLAKMKLPMDLDKLENEDRGDLIQSHSNNVVETEKKKKKDGSRVFYGSRAFF
ncbi:uncharacterized protein [Euphorbia lathyris]|uniref:uncharacterized protein n=1 Tax=Euphorbia lathyris TaxID=212925 RepID=UPI0033137AF8